MSAPRHEHAGDHAGDHATDHSADHAGERTGDHPGASGPALLAAHVGHLDSRMGAAVIGSHAVFRGHNLHADLGDMDWLELILFGITGRRFSAPQLKLVHALFVYTSYPDARIWNNRVAALAGSARSTPALAGSARSTPALALAAALAVSEAGIYGGQPGVRAIDFLQRARAALLAGRTLDDIVAGEGRIAGYGRPTPELGDERLPWLLARATALGLADGPHLAIAHATEHLLLQKNPRLRMNYAAMCAALGADMGLSTAEFHLLRVPLFLAGMPPGYIEARERPEGSLFPIPCSDIDYSGASKRAWPVAALSGKQ
jgi:hypothetical protein